MKNTGNSIRGTISLTILSLIFLPLKAQFRPDTPPTPQAVAFNRLGDYQVNNNYGMPDISLPLFEIDFHGFKIPLTLHYEASPLKPGYNYDVTGLGWTLSGNSCVSRTIQDRADENGRFSNPFELDPFENSSGSQKMFNDYKDVLDNLNFRYDTYSIVLPSGRTIPFFMYKSEGVMKYHLTPLDGAVKISYKSKGSGKNAIEAFTVTDEKGVVYHFTEAEESTNLFDNDPNQGINTTWLLTSIDIPAKGTITYTYNSTVDIYARNTVQEPEVTLSRLKSPIYEDHLNVGLHINFDDRYPTQCPRYRMKFLSSISYGPTTVQFNYQEDQRHMKEIIVFDGDETIRKFSFNYKEDLSDWPLKSLVISGQNNDEKLVYGFEYTDYAPGTFTDYWGNRCKLSNSSDIGNFNVCIGSIEGNRIYSWVNYVVYNPTAPLYYHKIKLQSTPNGDTRKPTSPEVHCVLKSITYPNGGKTLFEWENHRFPTATAANGDFVFDRRSQRIVEGGGFRIKSIINKTADGRIASEDYYRYGYTYGNIIQRNFPLPLPRSYASDDHIGCGEAVVDPNVLTFMSYSHASRIDTPLEFQRMVIGMESQFRDILDPQGHATWWDASFSANTFRSLLGGRRPVVYPEITVYHGNPDEPTKCKSKTVYKYDIYSDQLPPQYHYLSAILNITSPAIGYFESLFYYNNTETCSRLRCDENPAKRHQLKSKSDYSLNANNKIWNLVSEEKYEYLDENISERYGVYIFDSNISRHPKGYYNSSSEWLKYYKLFDFYKNAIQRLGKSTMISKSTTIMRQGGTCSSGNTQKEYISYQYSGVPQYRNYTDVYQNKEGHTYLGDIKDDSVFVNTIRARNMLAFPVTTETEAYPYGDEEESTLISGSKIDYDFYGNAILPSKLYEKNGDVYEESIAILSYDKYGNPTEIVDLKTGDNNTGIHSVYIWDTYGRYLEAMINNATLTLIEDVTHLLAVPSWSRYATLKTIFPQSQIQTWDYKPLIGVSSHTDVNGQTTLYEYDGLGRLKSEKRRVAGKTTPEIIHEYEYNYKNQ